MYSKKDDLCSIISKIGQGDDLLEQIYETIKTEMAEYIDEQRTQAGYYHNKFFKNERSIGLVRNFLKKKNGFIDVIQ